MKKKFLIPIEIASLVKFHCMTDNFKLPGQAYIF